MPTFPLGLASVAQATRDAGHEVQLLDLMGEEDPGDAVKRTVTDLEPGLIGISIRNIDDQCMENTRFLVDPAKEIVSICRSVCRAPIVLGGAGYSIFPQAVLEYLGADMGIQGEGECAFPLLIDRIQRGPDDLSQVPGLYLLSRGLQRPRRFEKNLDVLCLPDLSGLSTTAYQGEDFYVPVQTRRGCPLGCSYCSTGTIEGLRIRRRSPEAVARWIAGWVERGFTRFHFVDNTFNLPPSYAKALCARIIDAGLDIRWRCILYPSEVDKTLAEIMVKAGCREVSLGFESGCPRVLKAMSKRFGINEVRQASGLLAEKGIRRMGFLLLGGPGETRESVEESLEFADALQLDAMKLTVGIRIYPYTKLAGLAVQEGVIAAKDDLLFPRFYIGEGLEDWLPDTVRSWLAKQPNWMM